MKITFIGDIHGNLKFHELCRNNFEKTIQVGDFGIGFVNSELVSTDMNHRFIRGNHDSPDECKRFPNWIPDGTFEEHTGIFFLGGAWSIDWEFRTPGISWWPDEECSYEQLHSFIDKYEKVKPRILVCHDAPKVAILPFLERTHKPFLIETRTQFALDEMLKIHEPEYIIHGHWHMSYRNKFNKTNIISLGINETYSLEI